jgi:hypothetical protein
VGQRRIVPSDLAGRATDGRLDATLIELLELTGALANNAEGWWSLGAHERSYRLERSTFGYRLSGEHPVRTRTDLARRSRSTSNGTGPLDVASSVPSPNAAAAAASRARQRAHRPFGTHVRLPQMQLVSIAALLDTTAIAGLTIVLGAMHALPEPQG